MRSQPSNRALISDNHRLRAAGRDAKGLTSHGTGSRANTAFGEEGDVFECADVPPLLFVNRHEDLEETRVKTFPFVWPLQVFPVSIVEAIVLVREKPPSHTEAASSSELPKDRQLHVVSDIPNVLVLHRSKRAPETPTGLLRFLAECNILLITKDSLESDSR